jgi:hypothetical protein
VLLIILGSNLRAQINFTKINKLKSTSYFSAVQTADMNNDGLLDVIGATAFWDDHSTEECKIFIYYQDSLGNLTKNTVIDYPKNYPGLYSMAIGDLNNDQLNDIVIAFSDSIGIFYQSSLNKYSPIDKYYTARQTDQVMCSDVDNNSLIDIIAKNYYLDSSIILFKQKETGLEKYVYPNPISYFESFEIGNLNQDKFTDALFKNREDIFISQYDSLTGYTNDNIHVPFSENEQNKNLRDFAIGDINLDGMDDILGLNAATDSIYIWKNDRFKFDKPIKVRTNEYGIRFKVEDLNCDGKNDILVMGDISVSAHESADDFKSFTTSYVPNQYASPSMWYNMFATGDLNNDGKKDLAIAFLDGIVIMKNTSKPVQFNSIDTIPRFDTLFYQNDTSSYKYFEKTLIESNEEFVVYRKDSFYVATHYKFLAYKMDTMQIRKAIFCTKPYIDTVYTEKVEKYFDEYQADTTLFYTSFDTLKTALPYQSMIENKIRLFPNPTQSMIHLKLPASVTYMAFAIDIISEDGRNVIHKGIYHANNGMVTINVEGIIPGVYLLKMTCDEKTSTLKFIKAAVSP